MKEKINLLVEETSSLGERRFITYISGLKHEFVFPMSVKYNQGYDDYIKEEIKKMICDRLDIVTR